MQQVSLIVIAIAVSALAAFAGSSTAVVAQESPEPSENVTVINGPEPGTATLSWTTVDGV